MPRSKQSTAGRILDYFRNAEVGEARAVYQLAGDLLRERTGPPASKSVVKGVRARTRACKTAAAAAESTTIGAAQ